METIQAKVNPRLLSKANRLFTGTLDGRIIEILQNARRVGATQVTITNEKGLVTVQDNGSGIEDFSTLLDLGNSDWDEAMEKAEDPAGVGVFCLAPRKVTICSNGKKVVITKDGWIGKPVELTKVDDPGNGTALTFADEPWELSKPTTASVLFSARSVINEFETSKAAILMKGIESGEETLTPPLYSQAMPYLERISLIRAFAPGTRMILMPNL